MCRRMLCRVVVDRLLDGNWQPHVEIDVGGGGDGEQAGDGGGEEALEEPGYSTCNMSILKLVKKGSIDACHFKQPLGPGKSQLVLTNLHDGLAIGPKWDAPKTASTGDWLYLDLGVGVHKAGSIEVHLDDKGFVVWNGEHGEMVFGIDLWKLVEGNHLKLVKGVGAESEQRNRSEAEAKSQATTPRLGDKIVLVASDSERRLIFKDLSLLNSGRAVSLRLANDSNLTVDITATGVLKPGQKGNPYRAKDWNHSTLRITSNVDTSFQVVLDLKTSSLLVGNERNRAFHVAWERNKQGDVVEIVDHYPLYNLGSSHSQQFVVNPDGTIALKSDSSLVLGYDGPHPGLIGPNSPPAAAEVRSVIGSWSQHNNIDMCGQGDVEIIPDWKRHKSIDDLKKMVEDRGYSAFTVSNGKPSFGHAALKKFDYILTPQHCKPVSTCCKHPCTIYIFTPGGVGDSQRKVSSFFSDVDVSHSEGYAILRVC